MHIARDIIRMLIVEGEMEKIIRRPLIPKELGKSRRTPNFFRRSDQPSDPIKSSQQQCQASLEIC